MRKKLILAIPVAALAIAGCGSAASTTSSKTTAPASTTPAVTTAAAAFLAPLKSVATVASTVPANGDINPYGIVDVPTSTGKLHAGSLLISNFNDKANNQGTGTTIVEVTPAGKQSLFSQINVHKLPGKLPGGVGLTTALSVLPGGYVVVGSLPTTNGKSATAKYGGLIVLNSNGTPVSTISGPQIQGPWDMTSTTQGNVTTLFVSNALNGGAAEGVHTIDNSTVLRIRIQSGTGQPPKVLGETVIANKIPWRDDPNALVIGPTGVALGRDDSSLFVADTLDNRIVEIPFPAIRLHSAGVGMPISTGGDLNGPLGLATAPDGNLLAANGGDGNLVEISPSGVQLGEKIISPGGAGALFGLAVPGNSRALYFVDDSENQLNVLK